MIRLSSLVMLLTFASGLGAEPEVMKTREFKVEFNLREMGRSLVAAQSAPEPAKDPFAPPPVAPAAGTDPFGPDRELFLPAKPPPIVTSKDVLTQMGILFPEGSTAFYDSRTSILRVHNTPAMLELIEAFFQSTGEGFPCDIVYTLTVIEGPGEIIRQTNAAAARTADASAEFNKLLDQAKQPGTKVLVVSDAYVPAKSGTRATAKAAQERIHTTGLTFNAQGHATLKREMQPLGLELELEPVINADGISLSTTLLLRLNLAAPELRPVSITDPGTGNAAEYATTDFFHAEFNTAISSRSGSTKLIGVTAPLGPVAAREDRLCAVFLTGTIHLQKPVPQPSPQPPPLSKALPTGMQAASFPMPEGLFAEPWNWPARPLQEWLEAQGVPAAKGASAVQQNGVLHIINTPDNIERIAVLADTALEKAPKTIACTLHTVQAPAAFLRGLAQTSAATSDHAALWAQVEAAVARGEGRFIDSLFVETKPDARAKQVSASECLYVEEFGLDAKGRATPGIVYRNVGSIFEFEPTLNFDGRTVDIDFAYELHPAQPAMRREVFRDPASGLRFDLPVADFHSTRTVTSLKMTKGGARLLSLYQPTGRDAEGMLWATFLKCDVVPQVQPPQNSPLPASDTAQPAPKAWHIQTYKVPPDFLSSAGNSLDTLPAEDKSGKKTRNAKSVLEASGILFPEGATAIFDPLHALLIVRNTQENLDLVEAYVTGLDDSRWPSTVAYTAQVFQGPGPLLRQLTAQAAGKCDHRFALDALLAAAKTGTVQPLSTARIETQLGTQATATQAHTHTSLSAVKVNEKNETEITQDTRQVGLTLSIEPAGRADGFAIDSTLKLEFHPAEPLEHREHVIDSQGHRLELPLMDYQVVHLTTSTTLPSGAARLVGLWKPTGKPEFEQEDILQMLIITCDRLWVEP